MSDTGIVASEVQYGPAGFSLGSGTITSSSVGMATITGLSANTCYDFYVRDSCSINTAWIGPLTACTKSNCTVTGVPASTQGDTTICGGGNISLYAQPTSSQRIAWMLNGNIVSSSDTLKDSITFTNTYQAANFNTVGSARHVGPQPSISTSGFGNFSNGQYIRVFDTLVIESTTVRANGFVRAQVIITDGQSTTDGGNILQRGEIFTTDTAVTANYQVAAGIVLAPGSYFIAIDFLPGTIGSLHRATSGAVYPYVEPGLISIDSVNFSGARYYYTYDLVVRQGCMGAGVNVTGYVPGSNAGTSASVSACETDSSVNLAAFLGAHDAGGTWLDNDTTGALTDSIFDATAVMAGNSFSFTYVVSGVAGCADDSATISVAVDERPYAGMDTTNSLCKLSPITQLRNYLPGANTGGAWTDLDGAGSALNGSLLNTNALAMAGTYRFKYKVAANSCPADSAIITLDVIDSVYAGMDAMDTICDSASAIDLTTYLGANFDTGGIWTDVNGSGGLSGANFDPNGVTTGQVYNFDYVLSNCDDDTATVSLFVEDCSIGISEVAISNLEVYPNPTNGNVQLEVKTNGDQLQSLELYSMSGQLVMSRQLTGQKATVDLSSFADGLYNLKVTTNEGSELHRLRKR
ncbi:MAG: T9SS type A sorting domain-containing protein [Owenweeksia sp.]|nr:T9SS type A sorting domain-containing protein [Owenweeksia sp.]